MICIHPDLRIHHTREYPVVLRTHDMFCAISGEPPSIPVVSKKSGLVFEQRLILKYIADNGKDPITGDELTEDDLVLVKVNPRTAVPRPPTLASIPALLASLQNEYDAVMMEMFTLKQAYDSVKQELAHSLYRNDSSERVIARLMHERDEARAALTSIQDSLGQNGASTSRQTDDTIDAEMSEARATTTTTQHAPATNTLPKAALDKVEESAKILSSTRKNKLKRKPAGYPQAADVSTFQKTDSMSLAKRGDKAGITAMDIAADGAFAVAGRSDGQVQIFDRSADKVLATLEGHEDRVLHARFAESLVGREFGTNAPELHLPAWVITASNDSTVRGWRAEGSTYSLAYTLRELGSQTHGLAVHPSGELFVAASDGAWAVYDVASGERQLLVETEHRFSIVDVHPDGTLIALGTANSGIIVYDIRNGTESARLHWQDEPQIKTLHFSENGYMLASAHIGSKADVEIWDLRKLTKVGTIDVGDSVERVQFDPSGRFLAVVGRDVRIYGYVNKTWELLWKTSGQDTHPSQDARWNWPDGSLISLGTDDKMSVFSSSHA